VCVGGPKFEYGSDLCGAKKCFIQRLLFQPINYCLYFFSQIQKSCHPHLSIIIIAIIFMAIVIVIVIVIVMIGRRHACRKRQESHSISAVKKSQPSVSAKTFLWVHGNAPEAAI
jgi:hypothetical protein